MLIERFENSVLQLTNTSLWFMLINSHDSFEIEWKMIDVVICTVQTSVACNMARV